MGFNKRKMASERAAVAAQEAEARRALGTQIVDDAKRLVADWNERQSKRMPDCSKREARTQSGWNRSREP
jgi:hypothetical protein